MKRRIATLLWMLALLFSLVGCVKTAGSVQPITVGYQATAHLFCESAEYDCAVTVEQDGTCRFLIEKPSHFHDFTLVFCPDGTVYSTYKGMRYNTDLAHLPYGGALLTLWQMLSTLQTESLTVYSQGGRFFVEGQLESGAFTMDIGGSGLLLSAECEEEDLSVTFSNMSLLAD